MPEPVAICPNCRQPTGAWEACLQPGCRRHGYHGLPRQDLDALVAKYPAKLPEMIGRYVTAGEGKRRWLLLAPISGGAFGSVFRSIDLTSGPQRHRALKLVDRKLAEHPEVAKRAHRESQALTQLDHSNIVDVLDEGVDERSQRRFIAMALVDGEPLSAALDNGDKPFSHAVVLDWVRQLLAGLEEMHEHDFVHRDIKPDNILVREEAGRDSGHLVIVDLGLVKIPDPHSSGTLFPMGTQGWAAPEQLAAFDAVTSDVGPWSDLYAAGVLCFRLLTGIHPFAHPTSSWMQNQALHALGRYDPLALRDVERLPDGIRRFLDKALAPRPEDRYRSVPEFRSALEAALAGERAASEALSPEPDPGTDILVAPATLRSDQPAWPWWALTGIAGAAVAATVLAFTCMGEPTATTEPVDQTSEPARPDATAVAQRPVAPTPVPDMDTVAEDTAPEPPTPPPGMVLIPAGDYTIGKDCAPGDDGCECDATPEHAVTLRAYFIDQRPVTVAAFGRPPGDDTDACATKTTEAWSPDRPVGCVTWEEASAHCEKLGKRRLPTELELEAAARRDGALLSPAGGALDEWTASPFALYPGNESEACWSDPKQRATRNPERPTARGADVPTVRSATLGFRCVSDVNNEAPK